MSRRRPHEANVTAAQLVLAIVDEHGRCERHDKDAAFGRYSEPGSTKAPRLTCREASGKLARPRGFEPTVKSASSSVYGSTDGDGCGVTRPAEASSDVSTDDVAHDGTVDAQPLPEPAIDLFVAAGALVAAGLALERAGPSRVEDVLQRVAEQCVALTR
jgi:hypothetical protein